MNNFCSQAFPEGAWRGDYFYPLPPSESGEFDPDFVEQSGHIKIITTMLKCFAKTPLAVIIKFAERTDMVYSICGSVDWFGVGAFDTTSNDCGITEGGIPPLKSAYKLYKDASRVLLNHIFWRTGLLLLAVIVCLLAKPMFRKFCLALPILIYDFGTMLFLGKNNDFRFFWCTYLIVPLVLLVLLRENGKAET